jgi:uncharacterized membrane protein YhiD involved in acid resistance
MAQHSELLVRLVVGTPLGAVIGYERNVHYVKDDLVTVDTSRIAASVVTGVGFLDGGAILRTGVNVQGLTTAAGARVPQDASSELLTVLESQCGVKRVRVEAVA